MGLGAGLGTGDGAGVGAGVGVAVGSGDPDGTGVGSPVGTADGDGDGGVEGVDVGSAVGRPVGTEVGTPVGVPEGAADGGVVGTGVGTGDGHGVTLKRQHASIQTLRTSREPSSLMLSASPSPPLSHARLGQICDGAEVGTLAVFLLLSKEEGSDAADQEDAKKVSMSQVVDINSFWDRRARRPTRASTSAAKCGSTSTACG